MRSVGLKPALAPSLSPSSPPRESVLIAAVVSLLLFTATVGLYAPVHHHPFSNMFDDGSYVVNNPHIEDGLNLSTVLWAFTHGYAGNWHPLTWISHAFDIQVFGLNPAGHHDENVVLHAVNAVLLFWVLIRASGRTCRSAMVAALFALHPINVESVAWVAERKTLLSTLFCLLALAAYRRYVAKPGVLRYTFVGALFVLGLLCKPQIIMLPLVLLVWDYWPLGRMRIGGPPGDELLVSEFPAKSFGWLVKEKLPLFFISVVDACVTLIAQHVLGGSQPWPLWARAENALLSYCRYVRKAFWPSKLAPYYVHPGTTLHWWEWGGACLLLLMVTVLVLRARKRAYLATGWLWFLIMLLPMIGLVQTQDVQGMADRYAYDSFLGLFVMICWGVGDWAEHMASPKLLLPGISVAVLAALGLVTRHQIGYWADDVTLWSHSTQVTGSWEAEALLGHALDARGQHDEAIQHFLRAVQVEKHAYGLLLSIATYEHTQHNLPMALEYYQRAEAEAWTYDQRAEALMGMWGVYELMGDKTKANECLLRVRALPKKQDWQGTWWQHIIQLLKQAKPGQ